MLRHAVSASRLLGALTAHTPGPEDSSNHAPLIWAPRPSLVVIRLVCVQSLVAAASRSLRTVDVRSGFHADSAVGILRKGFV